MDSSGVCTYHPALIDLLNKFIARVFEAPAKPEKEAVSKEVTFNAELDPMAYYSRSEISKYLGVPIDIITKSVGEQGLNLIKVSISENGNEVVKLQKHPMARESVTTGFVKRHNGNARRGSVVFSRKAVDAIKDFLSRG
jgi:hypothetical protein